jgi:hypothetical protein
LDVAVATVENRGVLGAQRKSLAEFANHADDADRDVRAIAMIA